MSTDVNPVLLLVRDQLEMNKRVIASILAQDIPVTLVVVDNSEHDETLHWALNNKISIYPFRPQIAVSRGWNFGLHKLFRDGFEYVLVLNADVVLPPWFYSRLLRCDVPFVTGTSVDKMYEIATPPPFKDLVCAPDFSAYLIRREAWQRIGPFDESMMIYASDLDYHIRAHRAGIRLWNAGLPFYHERSSTLNRADPRERRQIELRADADRAALERKWGCRAQEESYADMFSEETFGCGSGTK